MPRGRQEIRILKLPRRYAVVKVFYKKDKPDTWVFSSPEQCKTIKQILEYRRNLTRAVEMRVLKTKDFNEYKEEE